MTNQPGKPVKRRGWACPSPIGINLRRWKQNKWWRYL
jgi:hypothetical protein